MIHNPVSLNSELHLPNGDKSNVIHFGNVQLSADIHLKDVLVVPNFQDNLLSIPQLTSHTASIISFSANICIFQDPAKIMEKKIGEMVDGLYKT